MNKREINICNKAIFYAQNYEDVQIKHVNTCDCDWCIFKRMVESEDEKKTKRMV
jgi:hypothetical protein